MPTTSIAFRAKLWDRLVHHRREGGPSTASLYYYPSRQRSARPRSSAHQRMRSYLYYAP